MEEKKLRPQLDLFRDPATDKIKRRLAYLYTLADRGATEGEKKAARKAMERLINKYDIDHVNINELLLREYAFKYNSVLENMLLVKLSDVIINVDACKTGYINCAKQVEGQWVSVREIVLKLSELDYITLECAFEYFRRHMNKEWKRTALPILKRCRKTKTRNKKRAELQKEFFNRYIIASNLVEESELTKRKFNSAADLERALLFYDVEGGDFKQQVGSGFYLEASNEK